MSEDHRARSGLTPGRFNGDRNEDRARPGAHGKDPDETPGTAAAIFATSQARSRRLLAAILQSPPTSAPATPSSTRGLAGGRDLHRHWARRDDLSQDDKPAGALRPGDGSLARRAAARRGYPARPSRWRTRLVRIPAGAAAGTLDRNLRWPREVLPRGVARVTSPSTARHRRDRSSVLLTDSRCAAPSCLALCPIRDWRRAVDDQDARSAPADARSRAARRQPSSAVGTA